MIENVAPRSGLFFAQIFPPWRSMMERQIERPIPRPSDLVVMNGSKIDSSLSGAIPVPTSCTSSSAYDPSIEDLIPARAATRAAPKERAGSGF